MPEKNMNIVLCGIRNLLSQLERHGFSKTELKKIMPRITTQTSADIILSTD